MKFVWNILSVRNTGLVKNMWCKKLPKDSVDLCGCIIDLRTTIEMECFSQWILETYPMLCEFDWHTKTPDKYLNGRLSERTAGMYFPIYKINSVIIYFTYRQTVTGKLERIRLTTKSYNDRS